MTVLSPRSCGHLSPLHLSGDLSCVPVPPTIADDQTHFTVTRMAPVVLTCHSTGSPAPAVSWSKAGTQLGARGSGYRVLPSGELQRAAETSLRREEAALRRGRLWARERSKDYPLPRTLREDLVLSGPQYPSLCGVCSLRPIRGAVELGKIRGF